MDCRELLWRGVEGWRIGGISRTWEGIRWEGGGYDRGAPSLSSKMNFDHTYVHRIGADSWASDER